MRYRQAPRLQQEETEGRYIVTFEEDRWLVLEGTSATIWSLLGQSKTIEEVTEECIRIYAGDAEQIRKDVARTVEDLSERGLLVNDA